MKKINIEKLDLNIYEEVLDNGLRVYLCKIPRFNIHARLTALFGGSTLEFKLKDDRDYNKVPAGVAHFLEHKLFDKKDYDPLKIFENNGASANAFTNEFVTSYYFEGTDKFYENLNNLLKLVHDPYFTDENVLKEKGIILQEKKEDLDNVYSIVYDKALENTFHKIDYKNTVLGSLDDIKNITKEDLYNCYNTFYHPSNMVLTICGDINIQKTIDEIKRFYSFNDFGKPKEIEIKNKIEPKDVVKDKEVIYKDNQFKEIYINYKVKKTDKIKDGYLNKMYFSMLLDMKFSGLSDMSDIITKDENFISGISSRISEVSDYYIISFGMTVKDDTDKAINLIDSTLKDFNFDKKIFDLIKKAILNSLILSTENAYGICNLIVNQVRLYNHIISDMYLKVFNLDFSIFTKFIKSIDLSNRSVVILKSKKGD